MFIVVGEIKNRTEPSIQRRLIYLKMIQTIRTQCVVSHYNAPNIIYYIIVTQNVIVYYNVHTSDMNQLICVFENKKIVLS